MEVNIPEMDCDSKEETTTMVEQAGPPVENESEVGPEGDGDNQVDTSPTVSQVYVLFKYLLWPTLKTSPKKNVDKSRIC